MIDRRRMLMAGLASVTAPSLLGAHAARAADVDVAIVGAGAAGIAAALALKAAGRSYVLLEARDRLGGRAFTDRSLGAAYDAGAMFIHWAERNPWTEIARELGIATTAESWGGGFQVFAGGKPMPDADRQRRRGLFAQIDRRLETVDIGKRDLSVAELLGDLAPDLRGIATSGLLLSIGEEGDRISSRDYQRLWAGEDLLVPQGYGTLVARHGEGLGARTGQRVEAIDWSGPDVVLRLASGTIRANSCIVTVPVGVLKAGAIRFTPELPAATRDALDGIEMGALTKIAIAVDNASLGLTPGASWLEAGSPRELMNFDILPDGKPIIIGYCGGDYARSLSKAGLDAARDHVVELLARMAGEDVRKALGRCSFPAWWTDPFSQGSYSVCRPGHDGARDALARPIGGKILLAGEATAGGGAMTVGGATLAGRNAAAVVLRIKV